MSLIDDLKSETDAIVKKQWTRRDGEKIPASEDIVLGNECVDLEAPFLYADLVDSTELAIENKDIAAEVVKAYLMGTTRIIREVGGDIRSFDGDRVMGIFFGKRKNTGAGEAALKINYFFTQILVPAFTNFYNASRSRCRKQSASILAKLWRYEAASGTITISSGSAAHRIS